VHIIYIICVVVVNCAPLLINLVKMIILTVILHFVFLMN